MHLPMSKILAFPINSNDVSFANLPRYTLFAPLPCPQSFEEMLFSGLPQCKNLWTFC